MDVMIKHQVRNCAPSVMHHCMIEHMSTPQVSMCMTITRPWAPLSTAWSTAVCVGSDPLKLNRASGSGICIHQEYKVGLDENNAVNLKPSSSWYSHLQRPMFMWKKKRCHFTLQIYRWIATCGFLFNGKNRWLGKHFALSLCCSEVAFCVVMITLFNEDLWQRLLGKQDTFHRTSEAAFYAVMTDILHCI